MKRIALLAIIVSVLLAGCASPSTLMSPCVGAPGSPCSRSLLPNEPMEVTV